MKNFLASERLSFRLDLSQSSIIEIIDAYVNFKKTSNAEYKSYDLYHVPQSFSPRLALSQDEISHIAHFDLYSYPGRPQTVRTLVSVRDTFILCCNLGQRYSDIVRIGPKNFNRNIYRTIQKKTGCKAVVDIDRYGYRSPYQSTSSNFNMYLHKVLRLIGEEFNDIVTTETKVNGVMMRESNPK